MAQVIPQLRSADETCYILKFDQSPPLPVRPFLLPELKRRGEMESATSSVAEEVWKAIDSTQSVTEDQLSVLHFLYGKNFEKATRIVDVGGVKKISGEPSQRSIFQVMGESKKKDAYFCFPQHYCACYSFFYDFVNRGEQLCCKHQLAARLAEAMRVCSEVKVSDEELALLLFDL